MKPKFYWDMPQYFHDPADPYNYQVNEEWLALRADRITASYAKELLVNGKSASGLGDVITQRLERRVMQKHSGWIDDESISYQDKEAVRRGLVYESEAIEWFKSVKKVCVRRCGFVERGSYLGCSPDGAMESDRALVQVKIPMPDNFLRAIMADGKDYIAQCKTELFVCDYLKNYLVIYSPELGYGFIKEIDRDPEHDKALMSKMRVAIQHQQRGEVILDDLRRRYESCQ